MSSYPTCRACGSDLTSSEEQEEGLCFECQDQQDQQLPRENLPGRNNGNRKEVNPVIDQAELFSEAKVVMKDVRFMPAEEKWKVLRQWTLFLKNGCSKDYFAKSLYNYLINHCSFIAHYDRHGFYATYFEEPEDSIHFLSQFDNQNGIPKSVEYGMIYWYTNSDYNDINAEMCRIASRYIPDLIKKCQAAQQEKDVTRAELLLAKHGLKASIG